MDLPLDRLPSSHAQPAPSTRRDQQSQRGTQRSSRAPKGGLSRMRYNAQLSERHRSATGRINMLEPKQAQPSQRAGQPSQRAGQASQRGSQRSQRSGGGEAMPAAVATLEPTPRARGQLEEVLEERSGDTAEAADASALLAEALGQEAVKLQPTVTSGGDDQSPADAAPSTQPAVASEVIGAPASAPSTLPVAEEVKERKHTLGFTSKRKKKKAGGNAGKGETLHDPHAAPPLVV